jgi:ATP-dependent Clp protease ATP-binding subunit ClpC
MMFERYTEGARRALFFARYEVSHLGGRSIESEHLLLGMIREGSVERSLSEQAHVSIEQICQAIVGRLTPHEKLSTSVEIPFSDETKRILKHAAAESQQLGHDFIGPQHLLLGIMREEGCAAAAVLMALGVGIEPVREAARELRPPAST